MSGSSDTVTDRLKIVMLGAFGVGKTSLTRRFVTGEFSEKYVSTLGVRIEKRTVAVGALTVELLVWDIAGHDDFASFRPAYIRGAAGVLLVCDQTRMSTVGTLVEIQDLVRTHLGEVPSEVLVNKNDLAPDPAFERAMRDSGLGPARLTSARTGVNVAEAFVGLAERAVAGRTS